MTNELKGLDHENSRVDKESWIQVMADWLDGKWKPKYPATWNALYTLLKDLELTEVASYSFEEGSRKCCQLLVAIMSFFGPNYGLVIIFSMKLFFSPCKIFKPLQYFL